MILKPFDKFCKNCSFWKKTIIEDKAGAAMSVGRQCGGYTVDPPICLHVLNNGLSVFLKCTWSNITQELKRVPKEGDNIGDLFESPEDYEV